MKSVLKISNMRTFEDINKIRKVISSNQGVVACQINAEKGEVSVVYDDYFVTNDIIVQSLEDLGYAVL